MGMVKEKIAEGVLLKIGDILLISGHEAVKKISIAVLVLVKRKISKGKQNGRTTKEIAGSVAP